MNLDFYLEKDILRRVKFLEYLYHRKTCEIPDLIDDLKVSLHKHCAMILNVLAMI